MTASTFQNAWRECRFYVAGVVVTLLDFLCHLFNHYPLPCWWTHNRVFLWAFNILNPMEAPAIPAHECGRTPRVSTGDRPPRCNMPRGHPGNYHAESQAGYSMGWPDGSLGSSPSGKRTE
jgi:hypothetical protein